VTHHDQIPAAGRALAKFIRRGWHLATEVHTIYGLAAELLGMTIVPITFMVWADSKGLLSPSIIAATALILFGILTSALLFYLGYRDKNSKGKITPQRARRPDLPDLRRHRGQARGAGRRVHEMPTQRSL
jgi:hypothetical protein